MDESNATIVAAIIAVIGVIITALISLLIFKAQRYSENVSKERMTWLRQFRDEIEKISMGLKINNHTNCCCSSLSEEKLKYILEAEGARYKLISRLNTNKKKGNLFNLELKNELEKMDFSVKHDEEYMRRIMFLANYILEREWKKVKRESGDYDE